MFLSSAGTLFILLAIVSFFFFLEKQFKWKIFQFLPPLIWIYTLPVVFSNTGVIPHKCDLYSGLSSYALPMFIVLMLLEVDFMAVVRVIGRGIFVMLMGTAGVVIGGPLAYLLFRSHLEPYMVGGFGALAGSWIGGTGNMAAVGADATPEAMGLAVIADNLVYVIWLPILLSSKGLASKFQSFTGASSDRVDKMEAAVAQLRQKSKEVEMQHVLYLALIGLGVTLLAGAIANRLPVIDPYISTNTWRVLLVTSFGILLSFTPARRIPGSQPIAMAIIYVFVASMGAKASLSGLSDAPIFLAAAYVWIFIHGFFCLLGAKLFKVDVHTAAIASAANIGGAASAPIVAACHRKSLVPVSVLMALIGYALGTFLGYVTLWGCQWVSQL